MPIGSAGGRERPDPADNRTEVATDDPTVSPERFSEQGDEAESAAFHDEGAYSGGDFAGGQVST